MSRSETKRRKVWVQFWGTGKPSCVGESRKSVDDFTKREVARFTESRPGDVVLSREDVDAFDRDVARLVFSGVLTVAQAERLTGHVLRGGR